MFNINAACTALNRTAKRNWRGLGTAELTRAERNMAFVEKIAQVRIPAGAEALFYHTYDNSDPLALNAVQMLGDPELRAADALVHLVGPEVEFNRELRYPYAYERVIFNEARRLVEESPVLSELVDYAKPHRGEKVLVGIPGNVSWTIYK